MLQNAGTKVDKHLWSRCSSNLAFRVIRVVYRLASFPTKHAHKMTHLAMGHFDFG